MPRMIFVNLPVADVEASATFYAAVGATRDERFCRQNDTAMMMFSDTIAFMLLSHARFASFTPLPIPDAKATASHLLALSADSREDVIATLDKAVAAGATPDPVAEQDHGFMYGRSFADPDGHIVELTWMDVEAAMNAMRGQPADA